MDDFTNRWPPQQDGAASFKRMLGRRLSGIAGSAGDHFGDVRLKSATAKVKRTREILPIGSSASCGSQNTTATGVAPSGISKAMASEDPNPGWIRSLHPVLPTISYSVFCLKKKKKKKNNTYKTK